MSSERGSTPETAAPSVQTSSFACPVQLPRTGPDALHEAASAGDSADLRRLLREGASVDSRRDVLSRWECATGFGLTPLMEAAGSRHSYGFLVRELLRSGADPRARSGNDRTALYYAALSGDAERLRELLRAGCDANERGVLCAAAFSGDSERVRVLLAHGAMPNPPWDREKARALRLRQREAEAARLAEQGMDQDRIADLLGPDDGGPFGPWTSHLPLHTAARAGNPESLKHLLAAGAEVRAVDEYGQCALAHAATAWCARVLLDGGCDPNHRTPAGRTVLMSLAENRAPEAMREVIRAGADVNARTPEGVTVLMSALIFARIEPVEVLCDYGAEIARPDGGSIINWIIDLCNEHEVVAPVIRALVERGASLTGEGSAGYPPLVYAVIHGDRASARALCESGAPVNARLPSGAYPWTWPEGSPLVLVAATKPEMLEILLGSGADPSLGSNDGTTAREWVRRQLADADALPESFREGYRAACMRSLDLLDRALRARGVDE